jgi:hypothetical protein
LQLVTAIHNEGDALILREQHAVVIALILVWFVLIWLELT